MHLKQEKKNKQFVFRNVTKPETMRIKPFQGDLKLVQHICY